MTTIYLIKKGPAGNEFLTTLLTNSHSSQQKMRLSVAKTGSVCVNLTALLWIKRKTAVYINRQ